MQLIKNLFYLSGAELVSKVLTFVAVAYLARVLGPESYGSVEFAAAVVLCAGLIVDQGFGPYGAREIARDPERTGRLVGEIVVTRFLLALVAYAAIVAFTIWLGRGAAMTQLLSIYGLSLIPMPFLLQWVFQGHSHMKVVALMQLARQSAFAAVVIFFVRGEIDVWIVGMAELAGVACAAALGWLMYQRWLGTFRIHINITRQLFRDGIPIGLSQMFWMFRMFGATMIVGLIASPQDVGFFGAAMRIFIALHAFIWLYFFNLLPSLSLAWQKKDGTFATLIAQSLHSVAWLGVVFGIVWVLVAPSVILGIYGTAFAPAGVALQWLAGVGVVAGLSGHYRYGLIATGRQNAEMIAQAVGSLVAIALLPYAYTYAGTSGAAIGLLVAESVVWWITWWLARNRLGLARHVNLMIRPLIATGFTVGLLLVFPSMPLNLKLILIVAAISGQAFVLDSTVRNRLRRFRTEWLPQ